MNVHTPFTNRSLNCSVSKLTSFYPVLIFLFFHIFPFPQSLDRPFLFCVCNLGFSCVCKCFLHLSPIFSDLTKLKNNWPVCLKDGVKERQTNLSSLHHSSECLLYLGVGQAEARSNELLLDVSHGWQRPKYLSHYLLVSRCINREVAWTPGSWDLHPRSHMGWEYPRWCATMLASVKPDPGPLAPSI